MDHLPPRSKEGTIKLMQGQRKGRTKPSNLREQVDPETMRLWRTPDAHCDRGPASKERMQMKLEKKLPISINDQVAHPNLMWPTARAAQGMKEDLKTVRTRVLKKGYNSKLEEKIALSDGQKGGTLNPMWVEWLMGYPADHTDLKDWEMLSSRKSQKK